MSNVLHAFVQQLHALEQRPAPAAGARNINSQALFAALLNNELRARAGLEGFNQVDHVVAQYFKAVLLCRKNETAAALAQLRHSDALMPGLPAAVVEFVTLFQLSAWGNYYYKVGESARAIDLLRQGFDISAGLERQGYPALIYRRLEQLQNIANILFRDKQHEEAHQLLKNTLVFAHSGRAAGLLTTDWDAAAVGRVRALQESSLEALFGMLADRNTALMAHPVYNNEYYYRFCQELLAEMTTDTYNRTVLYNWMYVKASYFEQGLEPFLANVLEFVSDPAIAPNYDVFKANLLAQAIGSLRAQRADHQLIASVQRFAETTLTDQFGKPIRLAA